MSHKHKTLGKPWSELSEYIFAFEAQNEAMIGLGEDFVKQHADWQCDRAKTIKQMLNGNGDVRTFSASSQFGRALLTYFLHLHAHLRSW